MCNPIPGMSRRYQAVAERACGLASVTCRMWRRGRSWTPAGTACSGGRKPPSPPASTSSTPGPATSSAPPSPADDAPPYQAFHNAEKVIQIERWLGLFHEESIQGFFLHFRPVIRFMNIYYGSAHFVVTIGVFALLFWKRPNVFPQWRNSLAFMTALAIFGFAFFPLMPPRLLDASCRSWGGDCIISRFRPIDGTFGFVDTLAHYGGLWSFNTSAMAEISNQYAAMPSLHIGWSTWCAIAMWPLMRRRWQRVAVLLYPLLTLLCIVVTANHYWLDGVGGLVVFSVGSLLGWRLHRWNQERLDRRFYERRCRTRSLSRRR